MPWPFQKVEQPRWRPRQSPEENAADSLQAKLSKLEVARQAILTQDLQALAVADRDGVKQLRDKLMFSKKATSDEKSGDDVGDIIVCDDYQANRSRPTSQWPVVLLGIVLPVVAAGVAALWLTKPPDSTPTPSIIQEQKIKLEYDAIYEQLQQDGTWKETKREHLK